MSKKNVKLKIKTLAKKGKYDKDDILLHACFHLLVEYVEKENPQQYLDSDTGGFHKNAWKEMLKLYKWWTKERPLRKSPFDNKKILHPSVKLKKVSSKKRLKFIEMLSKSKKYKPYLNAYKEMLMLEEKWQMEDQKKLHRLIEIRPYLTK